MPPTIVLAHGALAEDCPSAAPDRPTWAEGLRATIPLTDAPAFFGPPVIFLLGPWLLLVLLLIPPAALLITLALVALLAAVLLAAVSALIAAPYLLARHLRARRHLAPRAPTAGQEPSQQPIGPRLIHLTTR